MRSGALAPEFTPNDPVGCEKPMGAAHRNLLSNHSAGQWHLGAVRHREAVHLTKERGTPLMIWLVPVA
jgi:hypothetical protein